MKGPHSPLPPSGSVTFAGTKLDWADYCLEYAQQNRFESPGSLHSVLKIAKHAKNLTPGSEKLTGKALKALLAPMPLSSLMDTDTAKECLEHVAKNTILEESNREKKRALAAAAEELVALERGERIARQRARIAARPVPTGRRVDNCLRVHLS